MFKQSKGRTDLAQPGSRPERSNIIVRLPRPPFPGLRTLALDHSAAHADVRLLDVREDESPVEH